MRIIGVDLASQASSTSLCAIDWTDRPRVVDVVRPAEDDLIVAAAGSAAAVGIDSPLGWPSAFVELIGRHHRGEATETVTATPRELRLRTTDRWIRDWIPRDPLSVSTDRIGVVALRAVRLLERIRAPGCDRSGDGGIYEAYPGGSLARWGLTATGYKTRGAEDVRGTIVDALGDWVGIDAVADRLVASDDDLDAVLTAVVTGLAVAGRTTSPPREHATVAAVEGWIHVPTGPIEEIGAVTFG